MTKTLETEKSSQLSETQVSSPGGTCCDESRLETWFDTVKKGGQGSVRPDVIPR